MTVSAKSIYEPVSDPDTQARQENARRLMQIGEAYAQGGDVNFPGAQKHMRFAWQKAAAPLEDLLESLYSYFEVAAAVSVVGGGTQPFNKEDAHLLVDITPVKETISRDGLGNGLGLLGHYLADPRFQALCARHQVSDVYTPANDLEVRAHRVRHHNEPRPL